MLVLEGITIWDLRIIVEHYLFTQQITWENSHVVRERPHCSLREDGYLKQVYVVGFLLKIQLMQHNLMRNKKTQPIKHIRDITNKHVSQAKEKVKLAITWWVNIFCQTKKFVLPSKEVDIIVHFTKVTYKSIQSGHMETSLQGKIVNIQLNKIGNPRSNIDLNKWSLQVYY